jgi:hypothetical protein
MCMCVTDTFCTALPGAAGHQAAGVLAVSHAGAAAGAAADCGPASARVACKERGGGAQQEPAAAAGSGDAVSSAARVRVAGANHCRNGLPRGSVSRNPRQSRARTASVAGLESASVVPFSNIFWSRRRRCRRRFRGRWLVAVRDLIRASGREGVMMTQTSGLWGLLRAARQTASAAVPTQMTRGRESGPSTGKTPTR